MIDISVQIDLFSLGLLQLLRKLHFGSGLGASALTPMFIFCIESLPGMCVFVKERERERARESLVWTVSHVGQIGRLLHIIALVQIACHPHFAYMLTKTFQ